MSAVMSPLMDLVRGQRRQQAMALRIACAAAAGVSVTAVLLLGLSGWFLAGTAVAGIAGPAAVLGFNYVLPSAGIRLLAILRTGARYAERVAGHQAALRALAQIRPALFAGLAAGPPERSLALSSGEASGRLVQDVDAIETLFVRRSAPWSAGAAILTGVLLLGLATPWAVVIFLAAFAAQVGISALIGTQVSREPGAAVLYASGRLKDALQAAAVAAPELRCYGMQGRMIESMMAHEQALGAARLGVWSAEGIAGLPQAFLTGMTVAGVLVAAASASLPLAVLAALAALVAMEGGAAFARMFERDGAMRAAAGRLDVILAHDPSNIGAIPPLVGKRLVISVGGSFVELSPGERLALVGRSGSGKSRLLEALTGLRAPPLHTVRIDGIALETMGTGAARALFALAPQDAAMISGTLADNLRLGDPNASDAALWSVLGEVCLAEKALDLPQGLDSWIGEGGAFLSGGERRRLSLARAYLRPAPWLLLDEPTEGLDAATEAAVLEALAERLNRNGQGAIIVSHRPSPLLLCKRHLKLQAASFPLANACQNPVQNLV